MNPPPIKKPPLPSPLLHKGVKEREMERRTTGSWVQWANGFREISLQLKAIILAGIPLFAALAGTADAEGIQPKPPTPSGAAEALVIPAAGPQVKQGYKLFTLNCAHCHGADARGDEGPDLHGVTKSDRRIAAIIQNGIKGEMPKFSAKLNDTDTQALVVFIRALSDH